MDQMVALRSSPDYEDVQTMLDLLVSQRSNESRTADKQEIRFTFKHGIDASVFTGRKGDLKRYVAIPLDVSANGACIAMGTYLHVRSECTVCLRTLNDEWMKMPGRVVWCEYALKMLHLVGVHFNEPVGDQKLYQIEGIIISD